jgi:hypothetical protein
MVAAEASSNGSRDVHRATRGDRQAAASMRLAGSLALLPAVLLAGCLGGDEPQPAASAPVLTGAAAQAPASTTAGTLARVADGAAARTRLAYANVDALRSAELPVAPERVLRRVLGRVPDRGAVTVPGAADAPPETSAITPVAQSAAQSCLGDTLAQVILGPRAMGRDAALGVGLAESGDAPAGLQLRICGAPHYIRELHAMELALDERFGAAGAVIGEHEIGEREIVFATVPAGAVPPRRLLSLLAAGDELRAIAWR